jgi:hypothetical protein
MSNALRGATLAAGAHSLLRQTEETSRPALVALGLLAAAVAVALAHLAGTDVRASLASGQHDLLPGLVSRALSPPVTD